MESTQGKSLTAGFGWSWRLSGIFHRSCDNVIDMKMRTGVRLSLFSLAAILLATISLATLAAVAHGVPTPTTYGEKIEAYYMLNYLKCDHNMLRIPQNYFHVHLARPLTCFYALLMIVDNRGCTHRPPLTLS